jgi:DNA repair protein RadC
MKDKVNEIKVSYQGGVKSDFWHKISSSEDAAQLLFEYWDKQTIQVHESFKVVLLNNNNKVKGIYLLSKGGITATIIDLRILFAVVLKTLSVAIILTHNHPSGTLKASEADINITDKIKKAADLFDVKLLDHIIIAPNGEYYSFADNGMLQP